MLQIMLSLATLSVIGHQVEVSKDVPDPFAQIMSLGLESWVKSINENNFRQAIDKLIIHIPNIENRNSARTHYLWAVAPYYKTKIAQTSSYDPYLCVNDGVFAAFVIECILAQNGQCGVIMSPYYMNVIIPAKRDTLLPELTVKHMQDIQGLYQQWWNRVRQISLASLKHSWNLGDRALVGIDSYKWE